LTAGNCGKSSLFFISIQMIDWTDGFEILSLMGVDKGTRCTYSVFVRWDIMHTEIVHILLVAVEQLISEFRKFWNTLSLCVQSKNRNCPR
jgi:hypothetical protein